MTGKSPVLIYLVTEDWYFLSHRLPMARAAQRAGYEIHVLTSVNAGGAAIEAEGFRLHPLSWRRGTMNPFGVFAAVREVRTLYRRLKPDLVHHVALQPAVVGSLAAVGLPFPRLNALTGMGFVFTSSGARARSARTILGNLMRVLLKSPRAAVLVQNPDDQAGMTALGVPAERLHVIAGSGVDVDRLQPLPEPPGAVTAAYVGRLLDDKGVRTLVEAQALLTARGSGVELLLAGETDAANPAAIPAAEIENWKQRSGVHVLGHVADIRDVWRRAHIAVLPSRREGLPKSLLEAAACGRPIIASDVPGCREIARPDVNALLVPPDDPQKLADAIARLSADPAMRSRFGAAGRKLTEELFSSDAIGKQTLALYDSLLGRAR